MTFHDPILHESNPVRHWVPTPPDKANRLFHFSTKQETTATLNGDGNEEAKVYTRSQGPVAEEETPGSADNPEAERIERKENLKKKEKTFLKEMKKSQSMSSVQPIGTDRLFRRYWIFNSLNGLFIEDNDPYLPKLLKPEENEAEVCFLYLFPLRHF